MQLNQKMRSKCTQKQSECVRTKAKGGREKRTRLGGGEEEDAKGVDVIW